MDTINPTRKSQRIHSKGRIAKPFSQAERLARMVRILASRSVTINDLADEFRVSRRQIRRDLIRIEEQGHPLSRQLQGAEGWWSLPLGYKGLPPITISLYELFSLHLAKSELQYLEGTPFFEELDQVFQKMQAGLPTKTVNHLERIVKVFHPLQRIKRAYAKQSSVLISLRKALLLQLKVVLQYRKPGFPRRQPYYVDPYTLLLYQGGLYLRGFSHGANAMRTFAVERIKQVDLMGERFEIPAEFSSEDFGARLFGLIDEVPQRVRIQFTREVAYQLKERQWHSTQKIIRQKNGSVILTIDAGGLDEMASWILSWGPQAKVLEPPELVKLVKRELSKAIRRYGTPTS